MMAPYGQWGKKKKALESHDQKDRKWEGKNDLLEVSSNVTMHKPHVHIKAVVTSYFNDSIGPIYKINICDYFKVQFELLTIYYL